MKHIITAKLKLHTRQEQFQALRVTQLAYCDALNAVSRYAFEHGKMSNQRALQSAMYDEIRTVYKLPAQMACNVPRQVGANYKGLWTKARKNDLDRKSGRTKKRYKGLDQAPKCSSPTLTYNYQRDYSFKTDQPKSRKGKKTSKKQRRANAVYSKWSFAELQSMIAYKALMHGAMAIKVDVHYTSKACPMCGHTADANRPNKGLLFACQNCHYRLHADLVGARNIAMRTLLIRQDWISTGILSECLDGSSDEAKAARQARLARYAELRWNLDPSPALQR